ncbi:Glyoxylase, beta-lactamase superfamily II [Marininema mesophilum]|uniref:Glyoxylase, beta-lactamase superfamily II n=1 Tax=Marininema mesophilum TaxID=1048340 RepID=A0A1H2YBI2_9BACL|nr:MBL fold metallo-hydrolase [Marininema mesophilum]SDX02178.1 Glyoxylase, beta-lactamase superfamily II [Marininema mesophilum]
MQPIQIIDWGFDIFMIEGYDLGMAGRTGIYVIEAEELTLVETGPSPSVPYILEGLKERGYAPEDVKNVIVTHIHLDHAGGAGLLCQSCPDARVVVHPRGARHLADPSRLIEGAKMVYGDQFASLFDPVLPIDPARILIREDGDTLDIGKGHLLQFINSPGHAAHHFSIFDPVSKGIFTGDTAGIYYQQTEEYGFQFCLPSTSPNQFDPDAMRNSIARFETIGPERLFFGHFGMMDNPAEAYRQVLDGLDRFIDTASKAFKEGEGAKGVEERLKNHYHSYLLAQGIPQKHGLFTILNLDLEVSAMGIEHYWNKNDESK